MSEQPTPELLKPNRSRTTPYFAISLGTALIYFFSNPKPQNFYDYPFRVAGNLLRGSVGFRQRRPTWLNEFVPFDGFYYSVFPLGAVVSMVPFALLKVLDTITEMPGAWIAALLAEYLSSPMMNLS